MGYGRRYGCGCSGMGSAFGPRQAVINGGAVKPARGFRGPVGQQAPARVTVSQPYVPPPVQHVPVKLPASSYDDPTRSDPAMQFRYSEGQIREMLQRGASETMERSGESDSGLPADEAAQQQSREASATADFESNGSGPGFTVTESDAPPNYWPLIAAIGAAWFLGT